MVKMSNMANLSNLSSRQKMAAGLGMAALAGTGEYLRRRGVPEWAGGRTQEMRAYQAAEAEYVDLAKKCHRFNYILKNINNLEPRIKKMTRELRDRVKLVELESITNAKEMRGRCQTLVQQMEQPNEEDINEYFTLDELEKQRMKQEAERWEKMSPSEKLMDYGSKKRPEWSKLENWDGWRPSFPWGGSGDV